jgi:hypothetical protein
MFLQFILLIVIDILFFYPIYTLYFLLIIIYERKINILSLIYYIIIDYYQIAALFGVLYKALVKFGKEEI